MRVMKSKTLLESFRENLDEIDNNIKRLNESEVIWSSDNTDQYADWSEEDFIEEYKNQTGEEPESADAARDYFINDDDYALWDILKDDLESYVPSIQAQTTDNIIIMSGTVGVWTGNHQGGKVIRLESADDLLIGDDIDVIRLLNEDGNLVWEGIHHDGKHYMGLYGLPKDEETRVKLVQDLGIVDWYRDMYDYDDENGALNDALTCLQSVDELKNALTVEDYAKITEYCNPIKVDKLNESALEPQYSGRKSFYGKANVETEPDGSKVLTSYSTKVVKVKDGQVEVLCDEDALTQTTLRHIREFLQQEGIEPLSKSELVKLINDKGEELNEAFNLDDALADVTEYAESIYKGSEINSSTISSLLNSHEGLKDKYTENQKDKIIKWFEDQEEMYTPMNEQDSTVRVVTTQQEDRDYAITDITDLNTISDGDVQPPIDITGLLVEVDNRLTESYGADWGQINFQSTRFNVDTNDSNALFELCVGKNTYLMSMLLEENGSLLRVNNTKGKTIFKRKSNDITSLAESYIKQFLPKEVEKVPAVIKRINQDLHDAYDFLKSQIALVKDVPKDEKEAFKAYLQGQIYAFVAEVSNEVKANEPTDEDKLELPSFDKMVEEIFGKDWVKEQPKENKLELDGVETLKESFFVKIWNDDAEDYSDYAEYKTKEEAQKEVDALKKNGEKAIIETFSEKSRDPELSDEVDYYNKTYNGITESINTNIEKEGHYVGYVKLGNGTTFDVYEKDGEYFDGQGFPISKEELDSLNVIKESAEEGLRDKAWEKVGKGEQLSQEEYVGLLSAEPGKGAIILGGGPNGEDVKVMPDGTKKKYDVKNHKVIEEADELENEEPATEEPKNGLGTGYASFVRKPSNISDLDDKAKYFTSGDSEYLICEKHSLSDEEFDKIESDFFQPNSYCKAFEPLDTDNYSYNVMEFSCPSKDYKLLVDPSGYDYCRYVAKVGGSDEIK